MLKIKLLNPPTFDEVSAGMPRLGIPVLVGFLRENGAEVEQDDLLEKVRFVNKKSIFGNKISMEVFRNTKKVLCYINENKQVKSIEKICDSVISLTKINNFDVIGFSVHSIFEFPFALALSKRIKERYSKKIILGGPYITLEGHKLAEKLDYIDKVFIGDSEYELLNYLLERKKRNKKIKIEDAPIPDFDSLPLKLYKKNINGRQAFVIPYMLTKGCTNRCSFCTHNSFHKIEFKSPKKVTTDIMSLSKKYDSCYFEFCDSSLNMSYEYLEKICDGMISTKLGIKWASMIRPDNLDSKLLIKMKKSGCTLLRFGVESFIDKTLRHMGKKHTSMEALTNIMTAKKIGIKTELFLITGYINETEHEVEKTIQILKENKEIFDMAQTNILRVDYGSLIYKNPEKYDIKLVGLEKENIFLESHYLFNETSGFSWGRKKKEQIKNDKAINKAIFKYILKKKNSILSRKHKIINIIPYFLYDYIRKKVYTNFLLRKVFFIYCKITNEDYHPSYVTHFKN